MLTETYVIIVAAGTSQRMGGVNKIWMPFEGHPVLQWTLQRFAEAGVYRGVVVAQAADHKAVRQLFKALELDQMTVVTGGAERYLSVMAGLSALTEASAQDVVLIHDAARFLVPMLLIRRVIAAAEEYGAALPVIDVVDTVKSVGPDGLVKRTIPRHPLGLAQTPQGFKKGLIERAYQSWGDSAVPTDDAEVAERIGVKVRAVPGDRINQKLTQPEDVVWFEVMLKGMVKHANGSGV
ncbi:MAG: 2-C-methyl-D-erythritol 4-phosphate cytidylyltransferase [Sulfobacillus acidophilus]|uniref:2-C-methyl-D-erythritol 4-phosphate cytidylyltransferase n=1 Tax=Sulfobacillus acidophilus TaxID=53633 RepID=A0A2T2WIH0_9FIRM|nr:MAG: 2-C-methyl-D-erythritol 4-phosphate cytidylyltransferase [Sulfobacillus acidophilus]